MVASLQMKISDCKYIQFSKWKKMFIFQKVAISYIFMEVFFRMSQAECPQSQIIFGLCPSLQVAEETQKEESNFLSFAKKICE